MAILLFELVRLVAAATMLMAGASKLFDPYPMAKGLNQVFTSPVLSPARWAYVARLVAAAELLAALLIATRWAHEAGLLLLLIVGVGIIGFAGIAMATKKRVSCGCFGGNGTQSVGLPNLLMGTGLAGAAVVLLTAPARPAGGEPDWLLSATAALATVAVLVRHRASLLPPFTQHFQSFSKMMGA